MHQTLTQVHLLKPFCCGCLCDVVHWERQRASCHDNTEDVIPYCMTCPSLTKGHSQQGTHQDSVISAGTYASWTLLAARPLGEMSSHTNRRPLTTWVGYGVAQALGAEVALLAVLSSVICESRESHGTARYSKVQQKATCEWWESRAWDVVKAQKVCRPWAALQGRLATCEWWESRGCGLSAGR